MGHSLTKKKQCLLPDAATEDILATVYRWTVQNLPNGNDQEAGTNSRQAGSPGYFYVTLSEARKAYDRNSKCFADQKTLVQF